MFAANDKYKNIYTLKKNILNKAQIVANRDNITLLKAIVSDLFVLF